VWDLATGKLVCIVDDIDGSTATVWKDSVICTFSKNGRIPIVLDIIKK